MAVLITGGTGFVGLNLAQALVDDGHAIVFFDPRDPPAVFMRSLGEGAARVRAVRGDVRVAGDIERAFADGDITHVFHGAAITPDAQRETATAQTIIDVNLSGTISMVRAAAQAGVRRFVYPSSLTVYGENMHGDTPVHEAATPPIPDTIYGIAKYAAERAALRLGELWNIDVVTGRIGAVFGPWEGETGVRDLVSPFAQVAAAAARGRAAVLPQVYPARELIYGRDLARALMLLLFSNRPSYPTYNLSVQAPWQDSLPTWCDMLAARMPGFEWRYAAGGEAPTISFHGARPRVRMDTSRLQQDLAFKPAFAGAAAFSDYAQWLAATPEFFELATPGRHPISEGAQS